MSLLVSELCCTNMFSVLQVMEMTAVHINLPRLNITNVITSCWFYFYCFRFLSNCSLDSIRDRPGKSLFLNLEDPTLFCADTFYTNHQSPFQILVDRQQIFHADILKNATFVQKHLEYYCLFEVFTEMLNQAADCPILHVNQS